MIEFALGAAVGVALCIFLIRRYRTRDGTAARIVRRVSGITTEEL